MVYCSESIIVDLLTYILSKKHMHWQYQALKHWTSIRKQRKRYQWFGDGLNISGNQTTLSLNFPCSCLFHKTSSLIETVLKLIFQNGPFLEAQKSWTFPFSCTAQQLIGLHDLGWSGALRNLRGQQTSPPAGRTYGGWTQKQIKHPVPPKGSIRIPRKRTPCCFTWLFFGNVEDFWLWGEICC